MLQIRQHSSRVAAPLVILLLLLTLACSFAYQGLPDSLRSSNSFLLAASPSHFSYHQHRQAEPSPLDSFCCVEVMAPSKDVAVKLDPSLFALLAAPLVILWVLPSLWKRRLSFSVSRFILLSPPQSLVDRKVCLLC